MASPRWMSVSHSSSSSNTMAAGSDVVFSDLGSKVVLNNSIVQVTISKPEGIVTCIRYGGIDNLLEVRNKETNRGYWDLNWSEPGGRDNFDVPRGTLFELICSDGDKVEVSFARAYDFESHSPMVPLNIDKRFVLLRGCPGFYSYGIYERPGGWPAFSLNQTRITFKLRKDRFRYMAIADDKQRKMPSAADLGSGRGQVLAYPEAVLLVRPEDPAMQGEVDDKYQYSLENTVNRVHGWISRDPLVGFWIITPSYEFRNGGPTKQNLTCHVGPTCLAMFHSAHYAGIELCPTFRDQEPWQKVLGPVFIYLNSAASGTNVSSLWEDARQQMFEEVRAWPYSWPASPDFAKAEERGQIAGRLLVSDKFGDPSICSGTFAFLGLAAPGPRGSWQVESKGYQFWAQADVNGYFSIKNVRAGVYDLYGWVPGFLGDYKKEGQPVAIRPGDVLQVGDLVYQPPRHGPTIWEIGVPDRTAFKFFIPDPHPKYINKLYADHPERYRQYGLWSRYSELYPTQDLIYTVEESDWTKDWYFAHTCRMEADGSLRQAVWQIKFHIAKTIATGMYKLQMSIAASTNAAIQVFVNNPNARRPHFDTMQFGKDNAIARHGIRGLYRFFSVDIPQAILLDGENTIFLKQRKPSGPFTGVMYDYLRLEAPPDSTD